MSNIAISYARFSSAGQAEGHSLDRQIGRAAEYAAANGLVLDPKLSYKDLGLSGWDLTNVEKGDLGVFLAEIAAGTKIPRGATLIIESFDRLSRAEPVIAVGIFSSIIKAGLNVVTLGVNNAPPKRFSQQTLRENDFQLFEVMLDMHRANAESNRKSDLINASWENRRKKAIETQAVMTSRVPHWIKAEGPPKKKHFTLIPERVDVVRRVVEMAKSGIGNHTIIKTLNGEGIPPWSRSKKEDEKRAEKGRVQVWEPSYIQKMLSQRALYGAVKIKGDHIIEGYYPPLMTHAEYLVLQTARQARAKRGTTVREASINKNLFSGMVYCGYCRSQMILSSYTKADKTVQRYLACHGARTGKTDCRMYAWVMKKLENEVLAFLPEVDFSSVLGKPNKLQVQRDAIALLDQQVFELKLKIERVYIAIEEGATGMVPRVKAYETELAQTERTLKSRQAELSALDTHARAPTADDFIALREAMISVKNNPVKLRALREQLAMLINQTVDRITLHPIGRGKQGDPSMDITFKSGAVREHTPEYAPFS